MYQTLDPTRTTWHITWGTYGARLHGDVRPTVDKDHNQFGEAFIDVDPEREDFARRHMTASPLYFSLPQREFVESELPAICIRGDPRWWAIEGSHKAVKDEEYLNNAFVYIRDQRTSPFRDGETPA